MHLVFISFYAYYSQSIHQTLCFFSHKLQFMHFALSSSLNHMIYASWHVLSANCISLSLISIMLLILFIHNKSFHFHAFCPFRAFELMLKLVGNRPIDRHTIQRIIYTYQANHLVLLLLCTSPYIYIALYTTLFMHFVHSELMN